MTTKKQVRDGLYPGTSGQVVGTWDAASISMLKHYDRSPAHARQHILHPKEPTKAMDAGSAIHCAVFEPERFDADYVVGPNVGRRSNADKAVWRAFEDANAEKEIIDADLELRCRLISEAVYNHPQASVILGTGQAEVAAAWTDEATGAQAKGIIDYIGQLAEWEVVLDLKTTRDARYHAFQRVMVNLHYEAQAAYYLDGLNTLVPNARRWLWLVVEQDPPFGVKMYEPSSFDLDVGREKYRKWLKQHAECSADGFWPCYPPDIEPITMPEWALRQHEENDDV